MVRTVTVKLDAQPAGLIAGLATAKTAVKDFGAELDTAAVKATGSYNKISTATGVFGASLLAIVGVAIKARSDFDKEMSAVGAVAQANATQLAAMRGAALQAGIQTAYTATQAAQAEEELAKAGVSATDILHGGLTGALSLAAAGSIDLASAAGIAANAMTEFGLAGSQVGNVADTLTAGANKSTTDVQGLGDALGQTGAAAHQAGLGLNETVGVLSLFSQNGLNGAEAGTTLKEVLLKLEGPSGKAADLMKSLGISAYDSNGNFKSLAAIAGNLQTSLSGLTQQQRNAALATIFGSRAVRGAIDLYQAGQDGVQQWTNAVTSSGLASQTSAEKLDNLAGDAKKLQGSLQSVAVTSTGVAVGALRFLTQTAEGTVNTFASLPGWLQETATSIITVVGGLSLGTAGFLKAKGAAGNFLQSLRDMGPAGTKAAAGLSALGKTAGALTIASVAAFGLYSGLKAIIDSEAPIERNTEKMTTDLQNLAGGLGVAGELAHVFGDNLSGIESDVNKVTAASAALAQAQAQANAQAAAMGFHVSSDVNLGRLREASPGQFPNQTQAVLATAQNKADLAALDTSLTNLVTNGGVNQARIAFADLTDRMGLNQAQIAALENMLPNYNAAMKDAAAATSGAAQGFGDANANAQLLSDTMTDLIAKGNDFNGVWNQLNGAFANTDQMKLTATTALDTLAKDLKANKDAFKGDSLGALTDRTDMEAVAKDAAAIAQAVYEQTGSVDAAQSAYDGYIQKLRDTLKAAGLTKSQIDKLLGSMAQMPPAVTTTINTPGLAGAVNDMARYWALMDALNGKTLTTNVVAKYVTKGSPFLPAVNRWGGAYEHAAAGALRDPQIFAAVNGGARYAFAEPATGGEAFVPRLGNRARSLDILNHAAGWYGASVVPASQGMSHSYSVTTNVYPQRADFTERDLAQLQTTQAIRLRSGRAV